MKKIVISIALAMVAMMTAAVSFMVNDVATYKNWVQICRPQIMEDFGRKDKKDRPPMKDDHRLPPRDEKSHHDKDNRPRKEMKSKEAPAAPAPEAEAKPQEASEQAQ